jgi:hypothetical protein
VLKGKSAVLNVEQEHERRRRLDDEYSAKLHRDRFALCVHVGTAVSESPI